MDYLTKAWLLAIDYDDYHEERFVKKDEETDEKMFDLR
jgi:hypothetical protein